MSDTLDKKPTREDVVEAMLQQEVDEAWQWLLSQPQGKLILWSILDKCGLQAFPFYGNSHDALHRGRQQVGADILASHVYPIGVHIYTEMLLEAEDRQKQLEAAIDETDAAKEENENG